MTTPSNFRLYSFVNYYLSPLQHGLQTAHCVSELSVAALRKSAASEAFKNWAKHDKTIIICKGGNDAQLRELAKSLKAYGKRFNLPSTLFVEDEQSLNGAATATAIVVPESLWNVQYDRIANAYVHATTERRYLSGTNEYAFIQLIKGFSLA